MRSWLQGDESGREILRLLAEDPSRGAVKLLERMENEDAPPGIATVVTAGRVSQILNIASVEAVKLVGSGPSLAPKVVEKRLQLAWNLWINITMGESSVSAQELQEQLRARMAATLVEIDEVFGIEIEPPARQMSSRDFIEHYAQRIATKDQAGAAVFRLGGALAAWQSFKGFHGAAMDNELWLLVDQAINELGFVVPQAVPRVLATLQPLKPGRADQSGTPELMSSVAKAIAGV